MRNRSLKRPGAIALFCGAMAVASLVVGHASAAAEAHSDDSLGPLVAVLGHTDDPAVQRDVLQGMYDALKDRRSVPMPQGWDDVYHKLAHSADSPIRHLSTLLSLVFGDPEARRATRALVADPAVQTKDRYEALQSLVQTGDPEIVALLDKLLDDPQMTGSALQALAAIPDARTPETILDHYAKFSDAQKRDALATLCSRPEFARALLASIQSGRVPKRDLTPFNARQIVNLGDEKLNQQLRSAWGEARETSKDKLELLAAYKAKYPPDVLEKADRSHGRLIFSQTCGVCHTLFDSGGQVGPNLTGAQRSNLDYLIGKVLDPSAVVSPDYRMTVLRTKDGRVINGIVQQETESTVTLKAPNETIVVQKADIDKRKLSDSSLMPEGMLAALSDPDARDLLAYLQSPNQVALPK